MLKKILLLFIIGVSKIMNYETELEAYIREQTKKYLAAKGITPYQLGIKGEVSSNTVYHFIRGETKPSVQMLELIIKTLGITLAEFFKEYDEVILEKQRLRNQVKAAYLENAVPAAINQPTGLKDFFGSLQQNNYSCMESPAYIIRSADNKEVYVMAKIENNGRFDDGGEVKQSLILKDSISLGS